MGWSRSLIFAAAALAAASVCAQDADTREALDWLKKIAVSSRTVSYSGTFVYQHGSRVETSRVVHYVNAAGGVFEKLETLDGPSREVIRANDHVTAYIPDARAVLIERRSTQQLPVMLPENLSDLMSQYEVKRPTPRVSAVLSVCGLWSIRATACVLDESFVLSSSPGCRCAPRSLTIRPKSLSPLVFPN